MTRDESRLPNFPIDPLFLNRWSSRAMTGAPLTRDEVGTLLEAARWAPSSGNGQPWRILYALKDTPSFPTFFDLLLPMNQVWGKNAGALFVLVSNTVQENNGKPNLTHSFDTGAAWMSLALQGSLSGLVVHGIGGFDRAKARAALAIPETFTVEAMAIAGHPAPATSLPEDLQKREVRSQRKPLEAIAFEGGFPVKTEG